MGQCREECRLRSAGLQHPEPQRFVTAQWPWPSVIYPIYRTLWALYFFSWLVVSGVWSYRFSSRPENDVKWLVYLTNWTLLWLTVSLFTRMLLAIWTYLRVRHRIADQRSSASKEMTWYLKMSWIFYNTSSVMSVMVTLLYWGLIWTPKLGIGVLNVNSHGITSVCILTDIFITGMPIRILHVFHGMLYALLYILFTVIYDVSGGTNSFDEPYIYDVLKWTEDPVESLAYSLGIVLVGLPLVWMFLYGLYRLRVFIFTKFCATSPEYRNNDLVLETTSRTNFVPSDRD